MATCTSKNSALTWPASPTINNLCTPILCNAYSLPSQFTPSASNGCESTNNILSVNAPDNTCNIDCVAGYKQTDPSDGSQGTLECVLDQSDPTQGILNVNLACEPKQCAPYSIPAIYTGNGLSNGCIEGEVLYSVQSNTECSLKCVDDSVNVGTVNVVYPREIHETLQGNESDHESMRFSQGQMTAASGTIAYMAPELLSDEALRGDVSEVSYSQAVDVYVRLFRYFFFCSRLASMK